MMREREREGRDRLTDKDREKQRRSRVQETEGNNNNLRVTKMGDGQKVEEVALKERSKLIHIWVLLYFHSQYSFVHS